MSSTYAGTSGPGSCGGEAIDVDPMQLGQVALARVGQPAPPALRRRVQPADDSTSPRRAAAVVGAEGDEAPLDEEEAPVGELQRRDGFVAGLPPWDG